MRTVRGADGAAECVGCENEACFCCRCATFSHPNSTWVATSAPIAAYVPRDPSQDHRGCRTYPLSFAESWGGFSVRFADAYFATPRGGAGLRRQLPSPPSCDAAPERRPRRRWRRMGRRWRRRRQPLRPGAGRSHLCVRAPLRATAALYHCHCTTAPLRNRNDAGAVDERSALL